MFDFHASAFFYVHLDFMFREKKLCRYNNNMFIGGRESARSILRVKKN